MKEIKCKRCGIEVPEEYISMDDLCEVCNDDMYYEQ
jgi:hypothetical protein